MIFEVWRIKDGQPAPIELEFHSKPSAGETVILPDEPGKEYRILSVTHLPERTQGRAGEGKTRLQVVQMLSPGSKSITAFDLPAG